MAKKKPTTPEEGNDDVDELEDEFFEEDDKETPELTKKGESEEIIPTSGEEDTEPEEEPYEIEEEPRFTDYKYLKLKLTKTLNEDDYELSVVGQSHGFCNIYVNHLLTTEGVNAAAYKVTGIEPAQIFIRLEQDKKYKIKDILFQAIESLRKEVVEAQNTFQKVF
ncbi:hypothetical protein LCGC14_0830060 [marine sediment metagenome]|uniref:DNA-directed RNA polymerase RBP11-like dimerisation domain-containing protein n=1 Tax=marine sediment metagenome TaxID=412755 RepID=A0A0F9SNK1_9ZZZZ|nr:MAG: DNA-directed RNA polymerase subunit L [Candidatus Lokiarchaeum sp. GC14_75]HEA70659.1 hypothetical protein [archaeon]